MTVDLKSNDKEEEKVYLTLDRYYELGLRKDTNLTAAQYDEIKENEPYVLAYRACLRRLANRDHTVKEMYDYLNKHFELPIKTSNEIIDKLSEKGLLDDYRYCVEKLEYYNNSLLSKKKMVQNLRKVGVPISIIEKLVLNQNSTDSELVKAKKLAEKYQNQIHNKSLKMKKQLILKKLINNGFDLEVAKEAVSLLSFQDETFEEKNLLRKEANKAKIRFERKYEGSTLRNRVFHSLVSKGFSVDAVYAILNEMEWDDE